MPEGDTIHRVAARLRPALAGRVLVRFEAPRLRGARPQPGDTIDAVEAHGKHVLIHFGGGLSLRTHLRMSGAWHLQRSGEPGRRPRGQARVVIEADSGWTAVCVAAPDVEIYRRQEGPRPGAVARLGPDLCRPGAPLDEAVARLARLVPPETEVGVALLDQRVAAGIGNVYKSEVCFACGVDPFAPVGDVDAAARHRLYAVAHRMLRANLGGGPRRTRGDGLAVYGRAGRLCPRCGTVIAVRRQGEHARVTYWCPGCQQRSVAGASGRQREE